MPLVIIVNPVTRPLGASLRGATGLLIGLAVLATVFAAPAWAQKEVTSKIYREREVSTGLAAIGRQILRTGVLTVAPTSAKVRTRKYLPDAHVGLRFYERRTCIQCHPQQARSRHEVRAQITCRQCHGKGGQTNGVDQLFTNSPTVPTATVMGYGPIPGMDQSLDESFAPPTTAVFDREPIAGIDHYYSPMNRLRRHAFVCAKCHPGASASFATYVVHAPNPAMKRTQKSFPLIFYVFWGMVAMTVGTFAIFLPHAAMWGIRELFIKKEKAEGEPKD